MKKYSFKSRKILRHNSLLSYRHLDHLESNCRLIGKSYLRHHAFFLHQSLVVDAAALETDNGKPWLPLKPIVNFFLFNLNPKVATDCWNGFKPTCTILLTSIVPSNCDLNWLSFTKKFSSSYCASENRQTVSATHLCVVSRNVWLAGDLEADRSRTSSNSFANLLACG